MKVELKKDIPDQVIIDMIITALEGGSNYWYYLPDVTMVTGDNKTEPLSERIGQQCLAGTAVVPVHDIETIDEENPDGDRLGIVSKSNIERGIRMYLEHGYSMDEDTDFDANDADVFFQFVVMGEVVYG